MATRVTHDTFAQYPLIQIAGLAANHGFSLEQAHALTETWEAMQQADDQYRFWQKTGKRDDYDQYMVDFTEAVTRLSSFPFYSRIIGTYSYLISAQAGVLVKTLMENPSPPPKLVPQEASEDVFNQFDDVDIAYAAFLAELNIADCVTAWEALLAANDTRMALDSLPFVMDLDEVQYEEDRLCAFEALEKAKVSLSHMDDLHEIGVEFLRVLSLIS